MMPSCALDRWVEVIFSALIVSDEPGLAGLLTRFEVGAIEVDERELARDEQAGSDREQEPHAQHDVIHHASPPCMREAGRWGEGLQLGGSSIVPPSLRQRLGRTPGGGVAATWMP